MPEEDQRRTGLPRGQEAMATCVSIRSKGSKGSKGSMSIVKEASVACYERTGSTNRTGVKVYRRRRRSSSNYPVHFHVYNSDYAVGGLGRKNNNF